MSRSTLVTILLPFSGDGSRVSWWALNILLAFLAGTCAISRAHRIVERQLRFDNPGDWRMERPIL